MITLYTRKELIPKDIKYIRLNDTFFKGVTLQDNSITKIVLNTIDRAVYSSPTTFIGRDKNLGAMFKDNLSTGTKILLNIYSNPKICFDLAECGPNCLQLLIKLSPQTTEHVLLSHP
jgi:hypothetical protein